MFQLHEMNDVKYGTINSTDNNIMNIGDISANEESNRCCLFNICNVCTFCNINNSQDTILMFTGICLAFIFWLLSCTAVIYYTFH